jgi:hypothetical protein
MPELPELTVVQEVLNRRILGQTIISAEVIPPGGAIVVRDLTGAGLGAESGRRALQQRRPARQVPCLHAIKGGRSVERPYTDTGVGR